MKIFATFAFAALAACAAAAPPPVVIVKQASPNPLQGVKAYVVQPVSFNGLTLEGVSESDWMAKRTPKQQQAWNEDKAGLTARIMKQIVVEGGSELQFTLASGAVPAGQYAVAINLDEFIENVNEQTFHGSLRVLDSTGAVVDEVKLPQRNGGKLGMPLSFQTFVVWAAADTVGYLKTRNAPVTPAK